MVITSPSRPSRPGKLGIEAWLNNPARSRIETSTATPGFDPKVVSVELVGDLLVDGWPTPLKNMKVSWDYDIPKMMGNS